MKRVITLCGLSLCLFLPGFFTLGPTDRDESRFAQATKQMIESGDYVDIRFQGEARHKKPVGIYWIQSIVVKGARALGGDSVLETIWVYRIPSLLGAIGGVLMVYFAATAFVSPQSAFVAALLMASSILLNVEARIAKTDGMLFFVITAMMAALAQIWVKRSKSFAMNFVFWTALSAGILLKGPVAPMIAGLTILTLTLWKRDFLWWGRLRWVAGIPWVLLLVAPWFIAIAYRSSGEFYSASFGHDMLGKVLEGQEGHGAPPGTYLLSILGTFWPGSAILLMFAPFILKFRRDEATSFLWAWLIPSWIVFELVPTKLPHYVLPLLPALTILMVYTFEKLQSDKTLVIGRTRWFALLWPILGLLVPVVFIGLSIYNGIEVSVFAFIGTLALALLLILASRQFILANSSDVSGTLRGDVSRALRLSVAAAFVMNVTVFGYLLPRFETIWLAPRIKELVSKIECDEPSYASVGYREPSLVFLLGTSTKLTDRKGALNFVKEPGCRVVVIDQKEKDQFLKVAETNGVKLNWFGEVKGFNYNGGKNLSLNVYVRQ